MAGTENFSARIELMASLVEQLGKSLVDWESHREDLSNNMALLEDIKQLFSNIQKSLKQKFEDLEIKKRSLEEKKAEQQKLFAEREVAVSTKEQSLLDCLQGLKDSAVSAIIEARTKYLVALPVLENKVRTSYNEVSNVTLSASEKNNTVNKLDEAMTGEVKPRSQLNQLCEQMDVKGLLKYISDNRKNLATIADELTLALKSASEPALLVLDALEGFYPPDQINSKDNKLPVIRRTCLMLMESAAPFLGMASSEIKQRAGVIAEEWMPKLAELNLDASNGHSLEAQAFLQLLATFGISSEFDEEELCKLVVAISRRRRQVPELCRTLGLAHKMQDVIPVLISKGRQIDAVHFAHDFQLTESFPPVPLLKQYLEETVKKAKEKNAAGIESTNSERDASNQELTAFKAVVKCIEEYKIQEDYPLYPLQKRIAELERAINGKKRAWEATKDSKQQPRYINPSGYGSRRASFIDHRLSSAYHGSGYAYTAPAYEYGDHRACVASNYGNYTPDNYGNYMGSGMQSTPSNYGGYTVRGMPSSHQSYM